MFTVGILALAVGLHAPPAEAVDLEKLLRQYQAYSLPMPPPDAPLVEVRHEVGVSSRTGEKVVRGEAAYMVSTDHGSNTIWSPVTFTTSSTPSEVLPLALEKIASLPSGLNRGMDGNPTMLAYAIIEYSRGHLNTSAAFTAAYARLLESSRSSDLDASLAIGKMALDYWKGQIINPKVELTTILSNLRLILKEEPKARIDPKLLAGLSETVENRYAGNNENEKLIDSLCDLEMDIVWVQTNPELLEQPAYENIRQILDKGFDIVPALIRHSEDPRLTRTHEGFSFRAPHVRTVGEVCQSILGSYRNSDRTPSIENKPLAAYTEWWDKVGSLDKRYYVVEQLGKGRNAEPAFLVRYAVRNCPEALLQAFDLVLQSNGDGQVMLLLDGIRKAFPKATAVKSAEAAAKSANLRTAFGGLAILRDLDKTAYEELLAQALTRLPTVGKDPLWLEWSFASVAGKSANASVWKELQAATERAEPSLRCNLLLNARSAGQSEESLRFLANYYLAFLDDVSQISGNQDGRQIRDYAARGASYLFDGFVAPMDNATDEAWAQFRENVRAAIKARK